MEQTRLILKQYLTGQDISFLSLRLGVSISKIYTYLSGKGNSEIEMEKIVDEARIYLIEKYVKMVAELKATENQK